MKRLIRKMAAWDVNDELTYDRDEVESILEEFDDWLGQNSSSVSLSWAMEENPDCIYSGQLYRCIELDKQKLSKDLSFPITRDKLIEKAKQCLKDKSGSQVSYTKDYSVAQRWRADDSSPYVIIESNTKGLDINAFYSKWQNVIDEMGYLFNFKKYLDEQEVTCEYTNEYEIYSISGYTYDLLPEEIDKDFFEENIARI